MSENMNGWPAPAEKPIGGYLQHRSDGIRELDGHAMGLTLASREDGAGLHHEMNASMIQSGSEDAEDDVSGVSLDPALVRKARDLEIQ